ncbi:MAG: hypothetical protein LC799_03350 [Actinobacteria bacterium]|nr:hypothetical protein [Actinomycetota bacterium]
MHHPLLTRLSPRTSQEPSLLFAARRPQTEYLDQVVDHRSWPGVGFTMPFARDPASDSDVTHTVQGLAFVPLGISTGEVADAEHIDAGYLWQ